MKKSNKIISLIIFGVIIILILRENSLYFTLKMAGYNTNQMYIIEHSFNSEKKEFQVIETKSKKHKINLVIVCKNHIGFWNIVQSKYATNNNDLVKVGWIKKGGFRWYSRTNNATF
ncbi:hypothetical protein [Anaeromicropila herbilytica]|uniref:Uncharacterized protein n=1 Tax=Anaeromicropila herbilytica TaxID=2785025 RepID=A0A7R7IC05_9FIRM|nr:hypothetical protein [Anaeromicropila herbilytica]BCN30097.1 hypothetical protein bsdtb5_13920 [Anaeromicropila herbilytica]